jgi:hypothetical protein
LAGGAGIVTGAGLTCWSSVVSAVNGSSTSSAVKPRQTMRDLDLAWELPTSVA